jgi:hypothetical protein
MFDENSVLSILSSADENHEHGPSRTFALNACARRVRLDEELRAEAGEDLLNPANEAREIGTLVHKMCELYHHEEDPEVCIPRRSDNADIDRLVHAPNKGCSAWDLFDKYAEAFPPGFWGHLVGAELFLEEELEIEAGLAVPRTGKLDAIWYMDEETVARVEERFGITLNGPGNYVWDLKTASAKDDNLWEKWAWHPQPVQYMWLASQAGYNPRGHIVFQAVRYKTDRQERFYAVAYAEDDLCSKEASTRFFMDVVQALRGQEDDTCNRGHCPAYNRMCPHRISGACKGI